MTDDEVLPGKDWERWQTAVRRITERQVRRGGDLAVDIEDCVARNLLATWEQVVLKKCGPGAAKSEELSAYLLTSIRNRARAMERERRRRDKFGLVEWEDDSSGEVLTNDARGVERRLIGKIAVQRLEAELGPEKFCLLLKFAERGVIRDAYDPKYGSRSTFERMMARLLVRARQIVEGQTRC